MKKGYASYLYVAREPLTQEQENALVALAKDGDVDAQQHLLLYHEPYLRSKAAKYQSRNAHLDYDDLLMAARYGLLKAITMFDPARGVKFLTYAGYWIVQFIQMEINRSNIIWVPAYCHERLNGHQDKGAMYREDAERAWNIIPLQRVGKAPNANGEYMNDWEPSYEEGEKPYEQEDVEILKEALALMRPDYRKVLEMRYVRGWTLKAVGEELHLTRERIRQIQMLAIDELKDKYEQVQDRLVRTARLKAKKLKKCVGAT